MNITNKTKAYIAVLLQSTIIGFSFMFNKLTIGISSPIQTLAFRFLISFIALILLLKLKIIKVNLNKNLFKDILPISIFYPLMFFSLQIYGLQYVSSSEAGIINASIPIITSILAVIILKEKINIKQRTSILISVLGVILIVVLGSNSGATKNIKGIALILMSALSTSINFILIRKYSKKYHFLDMTFVSITSGFVVFNSINLITHILNNNLNIILQPFKSNTFIIAILFLSLLSTLLTASLSNFSLSHLEASKTSIFNHLATLISIFAGAVILKEPLYYYHIIGGVFIISGVIGTNYYSKNKTRH